MGKNHPTVPGRANWAEGTGLPFSVMDQATEDESITPVPITGAVVALSRVS